MVHWPSPDLFSSEIPILVQLLVSEHPSPTPAVAFLPDVVIHNILTSHHCQLTVQPVPKSSTYIPSQYFL